MQSDEIFCDMINSIQFLNMSKTGGEDASHVNLGDSGFNSGAEMNSDSIFFYEDSCPSLSSCINMANDNIENDDCRGDLMQSEACNHQLPSYDNAAAGGYQNEKEVKQIKVNVGIDEDLKMILEMDPSLMDENLDKAVEAASRIVECPKVAGLPPKM